MRHRETETDSETQRETETDSETDSGTERQRERRRSTAVVAWKPDNRKRAQRTAGFAGCVVAAWRRHAGSSAVSPCT